MLGHGRRGGALDVGCGSGALTAVLAEHLGAELNVGFLAAVSEGREQGVFIPTASPGDLADFVQSALAGAIVSHVLHPARSPANFRAVLLAQLRSMLGLAV
ncbi:hypothetical protein ACQPZA_27035 [Pseudonocardia xinjiangensis]|uniref:hypothetical protein n=1 Tax=Pseudonocardia xinjiangensis TaxID=75289 RepID=UPI003D916923